MTQSPLVSVIIPAYNAAGFIRQALRSAREQTYAHLEILVVDDGSTDATPRIVQEIAARDERVRLLSQPNRGVAAARNLAIERSSGAFIAPLDADDLWFPQKIEKQMHAMTEGGPSVGMVYSWWAAVDEAGRLRDTAERWRLEGDVYEALIYRNFIGNASVPLFRRTCLEHVGGYDAQLKARGGQGCEDWDLTLRVAEHYHVRCVPAYLSGYRDVVDSMSGDCASMGTSYDLVMAGVQRRRPGVPRRLIRWSRSNFYLYLANLSYNRGRHQQTLYWLHRALRADCAVLLSTSVMKLTLKSLLRIALRPATDRLWPTHQDWLRFKHRFSAPPHEPITAPVLSSLEKGAYRPSPWAWKSWKPYDHLSIRRWQHVVERGNSPARGARSDAEHGDPPADGAHSAAASVPSRPSR